MQKTSFSGSYSPFRAGLSWEVKDVFTGEHGMHLPLYFLGNFDTGKVHGFACCMAKSTANSTCFPHSSRVVGASQVASKGMTF
jgi:hypothetical protein